MANMKPSWWAQQLQLHQYLLKTYRPIQYSTLNEKFSILPSAAILDTDKMGLCALVIGTNGQYSTTRSNGKPMLGNHDYYADAAALYEHLPFILRDYDNDLDSITRQKYGLRKVIEKDGRNYIAYYAKYIDLTDLVVSNNEVSLIDGVETPVSYVSSSKNLSPTPPTVSNNGTIVSTGKYLKTTSSIVITIDEADAAEIMAAAKILYGSEEEAIVNEIGLVHGIKRVVSGQAVGGQINYTEIIGAQLAAMGGCDYPLAYHTKGFVYTATVGAGEPQIGEASVITATVTTIAP